MLGRESNQQLNFSLQLSFLHLYTSIYVSFRVQLSATLNHRWTQAFWGRNIILKRSAEVKQLHTESFFTNLMEFHHIFSHRGHLTSKQGTNGLNYLNLNIIFKNSTSTSFNSQMPLMHWSMISVFHHTHRGHFSAEQDTFTFDTLQSVHFADTTMVLVGFGMPSCY